MSSDTLTSLAKDHPACRLALFADLSTNMVLLAESRGAVHREAQQALALRGRAALTAVDADPIDPETACDSALSVGADEVALFLRVPGAPNDALCCLCDPEVALDVFVTDARACLDRLAGGPA